MGCATKNETVDLKNEGGELESLKKKEIPIPDERPDTASTVVGSRVATPQTSSLYESGNAIRGSAPAPLNMKAVKEMDPNGLNITPTQDDNKIQATTDKFTDENIIMPVKPKTPGKGNEAEKKEAVRMFIPWEQDPLGAGKKKLGKPPNLSGHRRRSEKKKKKSKGGDLHQRGAKQQVFIPGSGTERILKAHAKQKISLVPLTNKNHKKEAKAHRATKSAIQEAREKTKQLRREVRTVNRALADCGLKDVSKLIRQYANISKTAESESDMIFVVDNKPKYSNVRNTSTRTVIKCPIKAPDEEKQ